ncbi:MULTISPECIES: ABC-F family ATP-binding cassette domain-containing protein [Pseudonocardia]|uniref:ABC transporter ATP-binding protein uup n=2 Tax=Pseudonocardia TaxID=1847 RepID=A0A1Y2NBE6_PSEAH|nr:MULTISPECIES: ABC-F family ATP-binding cassette domain-containing protein [Pseudonocardia]OSY44218.1 ABC transporter ATP-binding protein uup [Pseudonocardia autotrophica]TDN74052.1 ATPase subunit of ABC transporter with duplicated ATPase domains [Pseudonocardia autotrophica]BBG04809.1 ABC transporter ATP-binding protein [Pseudonocardia autotrophica]GEC23465.1 ABC transporter ATP-binding protein [Pseudonocardia saturnea]
MTATLHASGLAAGHGDRSLFSGLDLVVAPGDVIGLVGANGAGKSTLLSILAGTRAPDAGALTLAPPDATVGLLSQEPDRRTGETVAGFLARRTGVATAQSTMDSAAEALGEGAPGADDRYATALDRWLALGGADMEERSGDVLREVGLAVDPQAAMTGLSGGQAARANLAALLLSRYDLLLLDEPTNDLDLDGLARLEAFVGGLGRRGGTPTVLVSHDREFLSRTVNRIVELDRAQHRIGIYDGGYEAYLAERETARRHAREEYDEYSDKLSSLKDRAVMQRNWMAQGVRNARRKTKDPDKNVRALRAESSEKQASKARQTERAIERLDVVEEPRKEWELRMTIASAPRSGSVVARLDGAVLRRGGFVLGPVTAQVEWADRVVVTGANGAGKSTLLAALLGRLEPESGAAGLGSGVLVGEIDQARGAFLGEDALLRAFGEQVPDWPESEVRTLLAKFALGSEAVLRPAASLSPGERTRAGLALLQARGVNLLVLDEPTNHLDLPAIEQLEEAVEGFAGTVLLVTHDRRMLDTVRATRRWEVRDGTLLES